MKICVVSFILFQLLALYGCGSAETEIALNEDSLAHCAANLPSRFAVDTSTAVIRSPDSVSHKQMVWIPGGRFTMGASDNQARQDEFPQHQVEVKGFWMDETEVTNEQFAEFVKETGYITTAERKPD